MHKDRLTIAEQTVSRPDYIPEEREHEYPAVGSIFCDFVPEGQTAADVHGATYDASPPSPGDRETMIVPKPEPEGKKK